MEHKPTNVQTLDRTNTQMQRSTKLPSVQKTKVPRMGLFILQEA